MAGRAWRREAAGGFGAGAGAAVIMLVLMTVERMTTNTNSIPELLEDTLTRLTGGEIESFFIDLIGVGGKALLLVSIAEGTILLGGVIGWAFAHLWPLRGPDTSRYLSGAILGLLLGLLLNIAILPLFGQGFFGQQASPATAPEGISQALYGKALAPVGLPVWLNMWLLSLIFALALVTLLPWQSVIEAAPGPQKDDKAGLNRREFGKVLGGTVLALLGGGGLWALTNQLLAAPPLAPPQPVAGGGAAPPPDAAFAAVEPQLVPAITPVENFYITTKNYIDPVVNGDTWRVAFKGLVDKPYTLTLAELRALPSVEREQTLLCISNGVGGNLISNARWRGVKFTDLLDRAGPQAGVVDVVVRGAEGYSDNFTLDLALHDDILLAYEMNGQPLTTKHGFPARLLVPNIYGIKNCKWLTEVELVDHDFRGYWQDRGWTDEGRIEMMSRIDYPAAASIPVGALYIGGVAFAGNRGISRVEVSSDGGQSWHDAALRAASNNTSWVQWTYPWLPTPGNYTLQVRASDGAGAAQTAAQRGTFPLGSTGYHTRQVRVG